MSECLPGRHIDSVATWCPEQRRNEPLTVVVSVEDPATGQPKPLAGATASWRVSDADGNTKVDKTSTINGSDVETKFLPADWAGLEAGIYPFYHRIVDPIDGPSGLLQGSFEIVPNLYENAP